MAGGDYLHPVGLPHKWTGPPRKSTQTAAMRCQMQNLADHIGVEGGWAGGDKARRWKRSCAKR